MKTGNPLPGWRGIYSRAKRKGAAMDDARRDQVLNMEFWGDRQLAQLCLGWDQDETMTSARVAKLEETRAIIESAVSDGTISCLVPPEVSTADKLYGSKLYLRPVDVIRWAASRFAGFPFRESDLPRMAKTAKDLNVNPAYKRSIESRIEYWLAFPDWTERQALALAAVLDPGHIESLESGKWHGVKGFDVERAKAEWLQKYATYTAPLLDAIKQAVGQSVYQEKYAGKILPVGEWLSRFGQVGIKIAGISRTNCNALGVPVESTTGDAMPELGSSEWRKRNARAAADAKHNKPGGTRDKQQQIRDIWASGKYASRDTCAEQECAALGMSYATARKALKNTPDI